MSTIAYIDGSNLLIELAKAAGIKARAEKPSNDFLELGCYVAWRANPYANQPLRRYWFASYQGNDEDRDRIRDFLRGRGFEPVLFKKHEGREKGVDISLTKEMLVHAFQRNCAESILVAGDEDYVPLVNEVKRYGQRILGFFFEKATSHELKMNLDSFSDLTNDLTFGEPSDRIAKIKAEAHGA